MESPKKFELTLVDPQKDLCEEWSKSFSAYPEVKVFNGYFQNIKEFDCLVSPANSFGLMDGGVDLAIRNYFGMNLQYAVQKRIQKEFYGEQPVGTSIIVATEDENRPFLAHTPTMRVPVDISETDNVYNAFFAMLRAVANFNKKNKTPIKKVVCPGLGIGEAARQMKVAYKNFMHPTSNMNWKNLQERNSEIVGLGNEKKHF